MVLPFRYRLSDREKDALLTEQAALIERQAGRIAKLEALLARPEKTSRNSHTPPSQDRKPSGEAEKKKRRKPRPSRPGVARLLTEVPCHTRARRSSGWPRPVRAVPPTSRARGRPAVIATIVSTSRRWHRW